MGVELEWASMVYMARVLADLFVCCIGYSRMLALVGILFMFSLRKGVCWSRLFWGGLDIAISVNGEAGSVLVFMV
jgi:hypothetical protein